MDDIPLSTLISALVLMIVLSAFFSAAETAMLSLNRYRLRHFIKAGKRGAILAGGLLDRPDRLIGLILLCNNFVNIAASALGTLIGLRLKGETGIAVAAALLTVILLIYGEVTHKKLAVIKQEHITFHIVFV